ncbi:MAG: aminomethyltransferase family protein [Chthonomonadales bacterium]
MNASERVRTPLYALLAASGGRMGASLDGEVALDFGDIRSEHSAVRTRVGLLDRSARGFLVVTGRDALTWLQGLVTNDLRLLNDGRPCVRACLLNATGHVVSDTVIIRRQDALLLDLPACNRTKVFEWLDQYIITEDVEIVDQTGSTACISIQGPMAGQIELPQDGFHTVVAADHTGEGGYDVYLPAQRAEELWRVLQSQGCTPVGERASEVLRIEAGIPRYGLELTDNVFPLECGLQNSHISTSKGCYVGQEVIARILSRGHTNRALAGLLFDGEEVPQPGTEVRGFASEGQAPVAGVITSSCTSFTLGAPIALALLRREASRPGQRLETATGQKALVTDLPFVNRE